MSDYDELLPVFIEESQQHLQTIEPDILAIEHSSGAVDSATINRIFRGVHSIKGASGFFGLQNIGKLSHVIENSLVLLRDGKTEPSSEFTDVLLKGVDALRTMVDNVGESEQFDIRNELDLLQKLLDNAACPPQTVIVSEMRTDNKGAKTEQKTEEPNKFHVSAGDIEHFISEGLHLYAVKIFLDKDLRQKDRSPYEFINNMESFGYYVDSFLDIRSVTGLSDCLNNDLAFDFLFATTLSPDLVPEGLELPEDRVSVIDLDEFREELQAEKAAALESQISNLKSQISAPGPESEPDRDKTSDASSQIDDPPRSETAALSNKTDEPDKTDIPVIPREVQTEEKIRVGVNFLNELVNLAGELVLGRNQLMQAALPLVRNTPGLNPVLQHISRVTSEMQEKIMQMRMQTISVIFVKFHRFVRTLAKNYNKEIKLVTSGEDVELDKSIIEGLSDPLTHLIRNSVDHGIELPEEREKAGKPRYGTIELKAYHQGGQVHLVVSDDGKGVDGKFVAQKALDKGLVRQDQLDSMNEKERVRLIFRPGFSTVEKVTDLSGRGVGMDVVRTNIEHLGGTVNIVTKVGKGTTIKLVLPLTLAIVSGLLIKAHNQCFILPEVDIDELVRVKPDEIATRIDVLQDSKVLRLRDMLLPLVDLNQILGLEGKRSQASGGQEQESQGAKANLKRENSQSPILKFQSEKPLRILVIKHGISRFGLIVDSIESTEEIVVKPLPRYLKKMKCFSGVCILGNGEVSLILDVAGILKKAAIRHLDETKEVMKPKETVLEAEAQTLLLFDNNTQERFALPLELISRIERVPASKIERIKDKQFLQYQNKKLRLIFLENYLPVCKPERSSEDIIGIIVPKQTKHPLGIVMNRVINTLNAVVDLDTTAIMAPGLFGSAVLDGKITLFPDIYRIFELAAPEWYKTEKAIRTNSDRKYRVLLVDDTPFFRMVESEYLTSAGYEVIQAENGKKAMQILEEESVDAVILDIVMPKMDGWKTIRAIRADDQLKRLPVMAVTSLDSEGLSQEGLKAGFTEWELKLDKIRLIEKLSAMLNASVND
ncbi:hybrid sensor histidine kinase/response regulator [Desulfonema magnum]|uniref:Chemotaxis protein CheA n=1 Tax=Desulfonema magnum TaxID=45655 RepID=A0A975BMS4_9BACT|nr:chemotaxis protein CheW [Desulfonema magnum]QTA88417.1 Two component system response regulator/histidine kinase, CheW domain-containing [Desulfonema magnum]